jgi:hypothetical protein
MLVAESYACRVGVGEKDTVARRSATISKVGADHVRCLPGELISVEMIPDDSKESPAQR